MTKPNDSKSVPGRNDKSQSSQAISTMQKTIADSVLARVQHFVANKDIRLPSGYVPENAVKSAWLLLQEVKDKSGNQVLQICTRESIANALFNMVIQGLNPVKKQCDFIAYGDKLYMQREYHGTIALARRYGAVKEAVGNVIYEGDEFTYSIDEKGYKKVIKHIQQLDNLDMNKIRGAYATLLFEDANRPPYVEVMTIAQIRQAWMQGATKGASPAHKNFPDQMAIKTVISRACKLFISSSDDSALFDDDDKTDPVATARERVSANANREEITIDAVVEEVHNGKENDDEIPVPEGASQEQNSSDGKDKPGF